MKLTTELDLPAFFHAVRSCKGNITYRTAEGDLLNLKSQLSQYVFAAAFSSKTLEIDGEVQWEDEMDAELLRPFDARQHRQTSRP